MALLFLFVMLAAFVNSINSIATKYVVADGRIRPLPATFAIQIAAGIIALVSIVAGRIPFVPEAWPYLLGQVLIALVGFVLTLIAFAREDASVVGPVLGLKAIFLAFLESAFRGRSVGIGVWLGAVVSVIGLTFIGQSDRWSLRPRDLLRPGILYMAAAALVFSVSDLFLNRALVHWQDNSWAVTNYALVLQGLISLAAFVLLAQLRATVMGYRPEYFVPWRATLARARWPLIISGATGFLYQYLFFNAFALGGLGNLTLINILFNTRALLVVLLMAFLVLGQGSTVEHAGWRAYTYRTIGAVLTLGAIALAMVVR